MRVFLVQTAKGLFSSSGGYKANICLLRYLASRGHSVCQLCYSHRGEADAVVRTMAKGGGHDPQLHKRQLHLRGGYGEDGTDIAVDELVMEDGVQYLALENEAFVEAFGGTENLHKAMPRETARYIETGILSARLHDFVSFLQDEINKFSPTHIIFNDGLSMQATSALQMPRINARRIAVIHTAEQLPFGPFAGGMPGMLSSPHESKLLQELDGIWSVSEAIKRYAIDHGKLQTSFFVHHPWTYLEERNHELPLRLDNWNKKFIGMINPCPVKGAQILVGLAKSCPQHKFLAYKSWGFDDKCGRQMQAQKNIIIRPTCKDTDELWRNIKLLLVPSLWFEAWGIVTVEAHLRGIPVISSNAGALPEAMLGLDHVIPVNTMNGDCDEEGAYIVPDQDIAPWASVVNRLMSDEDQYKRLSDKVRSTTEQWLRDADEKALEKWLTSL
ncbi:UDP-Glycosyltransferase/glycogen phosphorylase [Alternaria alternata]|nr:UDP-Glycosyltransferase/glycogen phosphorylase [Alternaria alternata]